MRRKLQLAIHAGVMPTPSSPLDSPPVGKGGGVTCPKSLRRRRKFSTSYNGVVVERSGLGPHACPLPPRAERLSPSTQDSSYPLCGVVETPDHAPGTACSTKEFCYT